MGKEARDACISCVVFLGMGAALSGIFAFYSLWGDQDVAYPTLLVHWLGFHHLINVTVLSLLMWRTLRSSFHPAVDLALPILVIASSGIWWFVDVGGAFGGFFHRLSTGVVAGFVAAAIVPLVINLFSLKAAAKRATRSTA